VRKPDRFFPRRAVFYIYDNLCDSILSGAKVEVRSKVERALALAGDQEELLLAADQLRKLASPE